MNGEFLIFFAVIAFGIAAFVLGLLAVLWRLVVAVGRALGATLSGGRSRGQLAGADRQPVEGAGGTATASTHRRPIWQGAAGRSCPNPKCGYPVSRSARYCSQCGRALTGSWGVHS